MQNFDEQPFGKRPLGSYKNTFKMDPWAMDCEDRV
jgi:hypothetical protein